MGNRCSLQIKFHHIGNNAQKTAFHLIMYRSFVSSADEDSVIANVSRLPSLLSDLARNVLSRQTWSTWQKWEAMTHGFRLNTVIRLGCFIDASKVLQICPGHTIKKYVAKGLQSWQFLMSDAFFYKFYSVPRCQATSGVDYKRH